MVRSHFYPPKYGLVAGRSSRELLTPRPGFDSQQAHQDMNEVEKKRQEVVEYEALLDKYGRGRWFWKYKRRLDELQEELAVLEIRGMGRAPGGSLQEPSLAGLSPASSTTSKGD